MSHGSLLTIVRMLRTAIMAVLLTADPQLTVAAPATDNIKAITWNVWNGFAQHTQTDAAVGWIKSQQPDVLALQELVGITASELSSLARQWGHEHSLICKEGGYPVGLTSNQPIELVERRTEGMHHGFLHARCADVDWFVVHLHPGDWTFRHREATTLAQAITPSIQAGRRVCVLGDFNAHSSCDAAHLAQQETLRQARDRGRQLRDHQFDFTVMQVFADLTLIDICDIRLNDHPHRAGTYPSTVLDHATTLELQKQWIERIDYVFLDADTATACLAVELPRGGVLEVVSDHYPIMVTLPRHRTEPTNATEHTTHDSPSHHPAP